MSNRIPREFIQQLLDRTDIVDIVDHRVPLKKKTGSNFFACCPFHQEKSASFSVSQAKQFYHCFGCGAHGNAIDFLMQFDRLEFLEAIEYLAKQHGLEIPRDNASPARSSHNQSLFELLNSIKHFYQQELRQHPRAIDYLKKRGLSGEIAKQFGIGYAPLGWDHLSTQFGLTSQTRQQLVDTGMLIKKEEGGYYDRFRDRIMFPIHDKRGRVIGFGGRILDQGEPKYLNSPETIVFQKGHELYGLYETLQANRKVDKILIVEGYMDVIALFQNGVTNAVATLGTATTTYHLERLFHVTSEIVFCFDGDDAGRTAAWRALQVTLPVMQDGIQIRFMFLPNGEDPDSLIRKLGQVDFEKQIQTAMPISTYFFQTLAAQTHLETTDGRARFVKLATEHLNPMPDTIFKQMMLQELANKTRMTVDQLRVPGTPKPIKQSNAYAKQQTASPSPLRLAISLLVQKPELVNLITEPLPQLELKGFDFLMDLIDILKNQSIQTTAALFEFWRDKPQSKLIAKLQQYEPIIPENGIQNEFMDALKRIKVMGYKQMIDKLLTKAAQEELTPPEKENLNALIQLTTSKV